MNRGSSFALAGRTRKGLTLLWIALFVFSLLLQSVVLAATPTPALAASGLLADTVAGFEVDGDLHGSNASTNPGGITPASLINNPPMANGADWLDPNGVASASGTTTADTFLFADATDPGDVSAYAGGNKEDDTRDWDYVNAAGPNPKTDFKHIMAHAEVVGNSAFAFLGAERVVNNGTMVVDFELNKKTFKTYPAGGPPKPDRTAGDLLISLEYSNGGSNPIVTIYAIANVQNFPSGQTVDFVKVSDATTLSAVRSATNFVDLANSGFGYTIPSFDFAEASIDLSKLGIATACPGFSTGHIRSRTGGDPASSQLKDTARPFDIDLNNCGSVTIVKQANPEDGTDFDFTTGGGNSLSNFSLDDDNNATLSDTKTFETVVPGTYTVTEAAIDGWKNAAIECDDGNSTGDITTRTANIIVGPNEHVTCTFTNVKRGKIIVEKQTNPDGAAGSFVFTGDAAGSIGDGGQIVVDGLMPGTYTSTENDPAPPFDLGAVTCDDNDSTGSVATRTATFHLQAGETIKCTFVNVKRGSITIVKDAQPNDPQNFVYTGLGGFTLDDDSDPTLTNTFTASDLVPGSYTVTETDVTGWELTGLSCNDGDNGTTVSVANRQAVIDLDPGQSITCTYVNTKAGQIIVDKITVPGADPTLFTFTPTYRNGATFQLADATTPNNSGDLKPGTYGVAETVPAGWDLTSATCDDGSDPDSIAVSAGEVVHCTFTNTKRGHIIVDKTTVPGGDPQLFTFTPSYNGGQTFQLADATKPNDSGALVQGTYSVSEGAVTDWTQTSATCDDGSPVTAISLQPGETVTCTFTNTKRGVIIVDKVTVPAGDPQLFTFTPSYNGGQTFQLAHATTPNNSGGLLAGTYSVSEATVAGWDLTSAACSDGSPVNAISLQPGEVITCTFTNTKRGHILIDKVTDPAGDPASFEFDSNYGVNFTLTDTQDPNDSGAIVPGTYSVAELTPAGWDLTGTSCSDQSPVTAISLQPGETVTCTFTNTKRGTIIVEKQTSPDGATGSFTFTGDAAGSIGDNGKITVNNLVPGTYTSSEADPKPDFALGAIVCDDGQSATASTVNLASRLATFELDPGETVTCVFTNVQAGTITIIKDAQPDSDQDFAFTTTGAGLIRLQPRRRQRHHVVGHQGLPERRQRRLLGHRDRRRRLGPLRHRLQRFSRFVGSDQPGQRHREPDPCRRWSDRLHLHQLEAVDRHRQDGWQRGGRHRARLAARAGHLHLRGGEHRTEHAQQHRGHGRQRHTGHPG